MGNGHGMGGGVLVSLVGERERGARMLKDINED